MPAMKLTPNAAMRARDVSRPRPEHLAEAEAAEASVAAGSRARTGEAVNQARGEDKIDILECIGADQFAKALDLAGHGVVGNDALRHLRNLPAQQVHWADGDAG